MDLRKYYLENVEQQEYYHNFYELINHVNETHNIFVGYEERKTRLRIKPQPGFCGASDMDSNKEAGCQQKLTEKLPNR